MTRTHFHRMAFACPETTEFSNDRDKSNPGCRIVESVTSISLTEDAADSSVQLQ